MSGAEGHEPHPGYAPCPNCFESSGYMAQTIRATWTDPAYEDCDYSRRCSECEGTGMVECEPRTLDDLDELTAEEEASK